MAQAAKKKKKNGLIEYFENSYQELRKVTWPTRTQAVKMTFLVLGFCAVTAVMIGVLDFLFSMGNRALLDLGPERALPTVETQPIADPIVDVVSDDAVPEGAVDAGAVTISAGEDAEPSEAAPAEEAEVPAEEGGATEGEAEPETPAEEAPAE